LEEEEDAPRDIPFQLKMDGRQPQFKNTQTLTFNYNIWFMHTVETNMSLNSNPRHTKESRWPLFH